VGIHAGNRLFILLGNLRCFRYRFRGWRQTDRHTPTDPEHGGHEEEREGNGQLTDCPELNSYLLRTPNASDTSFDVSTINYS
jgi:hypothetical protein